MSPAERQLIERFKEAARGRPSNNDKIDQYYNTPETNLKRLRLLSREPMKESKSICFLGDDDLTSLMFAMEGSFPNITVYDIDSRIINFVNHSAAKQGLRNYNALLYDYREAPAEDVGFDVFHSDPPATVEAVDLVLKRAKEIARPAASFYLSWPEYICDPDYLLGIQKAYTDNGWVITAKFPDFNEYDNACFFNYIGEDDRVTLRMFGLTDSDILASPPMQRYCLTRLLLSGEPGERIGKWEKELYLSNLHKIPAGNHGGKPDED